MHILVHNCHTQHRTVLIIFPPNLQTIIIALMLSVRGEGIKYRKYIDYRPEESVKIRKVRVMVRRQGSTSAACRVPSSFDTILMSICQLCLPYGMKTES